MNSRYSGHKNTHAAVRDVERNWNKVTAELSKSPFANKEFYRIRSPKTHCPWNEHIIRALFASGLVLPDLYLTQAFTESAVARTAYSVASNAFGDDAPARYLNEELTQSLLATDLPKTFKIPPPELFPSMHLLWPTGVIISDFGYPIDSLMVLPTELLPLGLSRRSIGKTTRYNPLPPGLVFFAASSVGESFTGVFLWDRNDWAKAKNNGAYEIPDDCKATEVSAIVSKLQRLAVNSWLLLAYRLEGYGFLPGVAPDSGPARGFDNKGRKVPMAPIWIGPRFRTEVVDPDKPSPKRSTGHASPRTHWRAGHYHTVCYGEKQSQRKVAWFKPTRVNG